VAGLRNDEIVAPHAAANVVAASWDGPPVEGSGQKNLAAMAERRDSEVLEILVGQRREDREIYALGDKCCRILPKSKAAEPFRDVHCKLRRQSGNSKLQAGS